MNLFENHMPLIYDNDTWYNDAINIFVSLLTNTSS